MAPKIDRREEGLRELASMIAEAYRRRETGEIVSPLDASENNESNPIREAEIIVRVEQADSRPGLVYTETVRVENFIKNRARKANHKKVDTTESEGGQNVTNKRGIRDREASLAGQNKTGDQESRR